MRDARTRGVVIGAVAAAILATLTVSANAEPLLNSELTFPPENPTFDPYGQGTTISGDVNVTTRGLSRLLRTQCGLDA